MGVEVVVVSRWLQVFEPDSPSDLSVVQAVEAAASRVWEFWLELEGVVDRPVGCLVFGDLTPVTA
jgi:hypothetical protein